MNPDKARQKRHARQTARQRKTTSLPTLRCVCGAKLDRWGYCTCGATCGFADPELGRMAALMLNAGRGVAR